MQEFHATGAALNLTGHYPDSKLLKSNLEQLSFHEKASFIRLWASEGIPKIFAGAPILYEVMRSWIGYRLDINPKCVTLVGSIRFGYSMSPEPKFGQDFTNGKSDLDLAAISEDSFNRQKNQFDTWQNDFQSGTVKPRHDLEKIYWQDNTKRGSANIGKGFIDDWMVPTFNSYPYAQKLGQLMYETKCRFNKTPQLPRIKSASIRLYRDWDAFLKQNTLNLSLLIGSFQK